jgi:hypothetical protein
MLIDGRLFCRPHELVVNSIKTYTKGVGNSTRYHVQEPELIIHYREHEVKLRGKSLMWDLLDAAHPHEPLPRTPINNDLFHTQADSDPLNEILTDLLNEGTSEYIELKLDEDDGDLIVVTARPNDTGVPDTVLKGVWDLVDGDDWDGYMGVLPYVDRKGVHHRDVLIIDNGECRTTVYDLGNKLCVMGMVWANDVEYRPLSAATIHKSEDYFYTIAKNMVEKYMNSNRLGLIAIKEHFELHGVQAHEYGNSMGLRTYEEDALGHERWLRLGVIL